MTSQKHDWRAEFRLHYLDMNEPPAPEPDDGEEHWILQQKSLRSMVATLQKDFQGLRAAGGNLSEFETTRQALLARLGCADYPEPRTLRAIVKFNFGFLAACVRETFWVHAQHIEIRRRLPRQRRRVIAWLRRQAE